MQWFPGWFAGIDLLEANVYEAVDILTANGHRKAAHELLKGWLNALDEMEIKGKAAR